MSNGSSSMKSGKFRYITIADHNFEHFDELIDIAKGYDFWAYIIHEPDTDSGTLHVHVLCMSHSPLTIKNHAAKFESVIPSNFVQGVISCKRFARYMLHLDSHEKILYSPDDIITNSRDHFSSLTSQSFKPDTLAMWRDYCDLRTHKMSSNEFLDKYRAEISELGIYQRFSVYDKIFNASYAYEACKDSISKYSSSDGAYQMP